jgi:hypothetical protein
VAYEDGDTRLRRDNLSYIQAVRGENMKIRLLAVIIFGMAAGTATAAEVPHPSGCPDESSWLPPGQMPRDDVISYNQCYSSQMNWSYNLPDYKISRLSDQTEISMQFSTALAGAAASLKVGAVEYLHSGGHGSALQYAIHPQVPNSSYCPTDPPTPDCVKSECYNPTEAGSMWDDLRNTQGFETSLRAQMHGPSTSAILEPKAYFPTSTFWTNNSASSSSFRSKNRLAYYVPRYPWDNGRFSGTGVCYPQYPNVSPHSYNLSHYIIEKEVRLGPVRNGLCTTEPCELAASFPVFSFSTDLVIEANEPETTGRGTSQLNYLDTVLIAYLRDEFNRYYRHRASCDSVPAEVCNCNTSGCLETLATPAPGVGSDEPLIVANGPGYAIGLFAETPTNVVAGSGQHGAPFYWAIFDDGNSSGFKFRSLQVTHYSSAVQAGGRINYKAYYVVGNLDYVRYVLQALRTTYPHIVW